MMIIIIVVIIMIIIPGFSEEWEASSAARSVGSWAILWSCSGADSQCRMLQLAPHYFLFSVPSEKLVVQDLVKWSYEKNIPKLLYCVLHKPIVGIVRPLTLLLPAVSYCGMNLVFEAGWPFVLVKTSMVIRTKILWKTDFFACLFKTEAESTTKIQYR